jgi:hypothetical protein
MLIGGMDDNMQRLHCEFVFVFKREPMELSSTIRSF